MKIASIVAGTIAVLLFVAPWAGADEVTLPPDAEGAVEVLKDSPRHGEFVKIPLLGSEETMRGFIAYPELDDESPVVIVIHEIYGMTDWSNSIADMLAREGFIAIAPDLISGMDGAEENPRETISNLTPEETVRRLESAVAFGKEQPAASEKVGCVGFCYGGRTTFYFATQTDELDAAVVYYGSAPETGLLSKITAPIQGHFGSNDHRVNSTLPDAQKEMEKLDKPFEVNIYEGAGHGFLRQQDGQNGANLKASQQAWPKTVEFFKDHLNED